MSIRSIARHSIGNVYPADLIKNKSILVKLQNQSYQVTPVKHKDDSEQDESLVVCEWDEATYLKLTPQYFGVNKWLATGKDKYPKVF